MQESLVLLKNDNQVLPLSKGTPSIMVAGVGANDIGIQAGGWTIHWQGQKRDNTPGTTILKGIQGAVSAKTKVDYRSYATFPTGQTADIGIAVVGEQPYAEGWGDVSDLGLSPSDVQLIKTMRPLVKILVVILLSGRPLVVTPQLKQMDALVAAWLPGTEGEGIADVLFGEAPFTGKLPYTWPRSTSQAPFDFKNLPTQGCSAPLFPFGYGLKTGDPSPTIPDCP